jgi:hypothetical protein
MQKEERCHPARSLLVWEGRNAVEVSQQMGNSAEVCQRDYVGVFADYNASNREVAEDAINEARAEILCKKRVTISQDSKPSYGLEPETPSLPWRFGRLSPSRPRAKMPANSGFRPFDTTQQTTSKRPKQQVDVS